MGYFRAAWLARENSLDLSTVESLSPHADATSVMRGVEAFLERSDLNGLERLMNLQTQQLSGIRLKSIKEYLSIINFSKNKGPAISLDGSEGVRQLFHDLVSDRSVSLVGPGVPHNQYGEEIDSADTVARVKFVGRENLPPPQFHGERCNIVYQAGVSVLEEFSNLGYAISWYKNIDLFVSTGTISRFLTKPVLNIDTAIPVYRTTPISGMVLLYRLISSAPRSLRVYGYDFRAYRKQYNNSARDFYKDSSPLLGHPYPGFDTEDVPAWLIARDFGEHDFVSNFCFAQNLYKAGLFDIEPYGKSILELTPYQYVERLEEMLGDW